MIKKINQIIKKKSFKKIVCLTAYSKNISKILDKHCDITLVGDSLANVLYGMKNTLSISLSTIITAKYKSINQGQIELGSLDEIKKTFTDFQKYLYKKTS